jgi:GDP-L-fucose synthase
LAAVIKKVHAAVVGGHPTIEMWGDGTAKREFTFTPDVAKFIVNCISKIDDLPVSMNVGAGVDYSVETYYRMVMDILGFKGQLIQNLDKPTGMQRKLTDSNRAMEFGWDGGTPIRIGLEKTIDWYLQSLES